MSLGVGMLIGFRCIQAIGAAMIFASSPAILTKRFPASQRGQALGMQATMTYLGLAFGPALGGWLADFVSWRAVFYINVPIGAAALAAGAWFIPATPRRSSAERFDRVGAVLFMTGLAALLLALNQGHQWGWASWRIAALLLASVVLLAAFLAVEMRVTHPMLDLSLFRHPVFSASVTAAVLNYICMAGISFVMPFYLHKAAGVEHGAYGLAVDGAAAGNGHRRTDQRHHFRPLPVEPAVGRRHDDSCRRHVPAAADRSPHVFGLSGRRVLHHRSWHGHFHQPEQRR